LISNGLLISIWLPIYVGSLSLGAKLGNAAFLLDTGYVFSVLFSWIFLNEQVERKTALILLVSIVGVVLILKPLTLFQSFAEVLALVSGIIFGFNLIVTRKTQQYHDSMTTIFYLFLIPSIVLFLPTIYSFDTPSLNQMFYIIFLGVLSGAVPNFLFTSSLKNLKTFEAGIPALLEPVTASIIGWIVFSEILDVFSILGGALIIGSAFYLSFLKSRK